MAPQAQSRDTSWNLLDQAMGPWSGTVPETVPGLCRVLAPRLLPLEGLEAQRNPNRLARLPLVEGDSWELGCPSTAFNLSTALLGKPKERRKERGVPYPVVGHQKEVTTCIPVGVAFEALTTAL